MAKFVILTFTLTLLLVSALSVPIDDNNTPDKPGYCKVNGVDIKKGESAPAPIGGCYENVCMDPEKNEIYGKSCGVYGADPNGKCYVQDEDHTKPFPLCCQKVICADD